MNFAWRVLLGLGVLALAACSEAPVQPDSYAIQGQFANAGVLIKVNGIPILAEEREGDIQLAQKINPYLKRGANIVEISVRAIRPGLKPSIGLVLGQQPAPGTQRLPQVLYRFGEGESARLPYKRSVNFDAADFPELLFWQATADGALSVEGQAAIVADLKRIRDEFAQALEARDAAAITGVMLRLPAILDLEKATDKETVAALQSGMMELVTSLLARSDATASTVTAPNLEDLVFDPITPRHFQVRRKSGGPLVGVAFVLPDGRASGLFIDQPLYGRVYGQWQLLRN